MCIGTGVDLSGVPQILRARCWWLTERTGRQRVPQRMHTVVALLAQRDMRDPGMLDQNLMQMILLRKRTLPA